jgi:hypothetical protein
MMVVVTLGCEARRRSRADGDLSCAKLLEEALLRGVNAVVVQRPFRRRQRLDPRQSMHELNSQAGTSTWLCIRGLWTHHWMEVGSSPPI